VANILIVDDDRTLLGALECLVMQRFPDAAIETCTSARESLERIQKTDHDVIVSDIRMPQIDGMTLLARVREMRPDTPIILITGMGDYEIAVRALRGGAFDYIPKPVDLDYFSAAIERAIRVRGIGRALDERHTELEHRAAELANTVEQRTRELRAANRAKDEFLATVSHELRTPLTTILGWSRLMLGASLDAATMQQGLQVIERNATHQARLVEDLLDVCRVTEGKLTVTLRPVRLGHVVSSALEMMIPTMQNRGIEVHSDIDDTLSVAGDPDRLHQITTNILGNAAKFTPDGGQVTVRLERLEKWVALTISDTGMGIAPEFLPHVFERFRQADASTVRAHAGLGVGLAIVKHLVELHHGDVSVSSEGASRGTTFVIRIPAIEIATETPSQSRLRVASSLAGLTLLAVDDDDDTLEFFREALESRGANVTTANSVARAIESMNRAAPDVVICDICMPHEDGYVLVGKMRASAPLQRVPAIAVSAFTRPDDVRRALAAGFDLHVSKPVDVDELETKLRRLVASGTSAPGKMAP